jgi:folylpolyglutamate synthase/dihydropteroate synthase
LIDGAHNEAGMQELKKYISSLADSFDEIVLCFALKKGKNPLIVTGIFVEKSSFIIVNSSDNSALENSHDIKTGLEKI